MMGDEEKVYVHWLASPASMAEATAGIRRALFQVLGVSDPGRHVVNVSPSSGNVSYIDTQEVWRRGPPPDLLPSPAKARAAAEGFLRELGQALERSQRDLPTELERVVFVPRLQSPEIVAVSRPDAGAWDHWLYRAQPRLPLGDGRWVRLEGAYVEIRIGHGGQIVSYSAMWQPILANRFKTELRPPPQVHGAHSHIEGADRRRRESAPVLVYPWEGDAVPQHYLAPFYVVADEHHQGLASATPYSLVAEIVWRPHDEERTEVMVVVEGGSGRYDFGFATYRPEDLWEVGLTIRQGRTRTVRTAEGDELDAGVVRIPNGAYVVMANVRDRETGAFRHVQQQVVSSPVVGEAAPQLA